MNHLGKMGRALVAIPAAATLLVAGASASDATTTTTPKPSVTAKKCDAGAWASRVQGTTKVTAHSKGGVYLYHNKTGFHLRVTHKGTKRVVFTGVITASSPLRMEKVKLEKGDVAKVSADHKSITFAFADYGFIDGINFHTDCAATVTVSHLNWGNKTLPHSRVFLGKHRVHPKHVPFTLHRKAPKPAPAPAS